MTASKKPKAQVIKLQAHKAQQEPKPGESGAKMKIVTSYYNENHQVIKVIRSYFASTAVPRAFKHMHDNDYGANVVEVFDETTGEVHAVIRRRLTPTGKDSISTILERDLEEIMRKEGKLV